MLMGKTKRMWCVLLFQLLLSDVALAADHYVSLMKPQFELLTGRFSKHVMDFTTLPENQEVYMTYWGSTPEAEFKYDNKRLLVSYRGNDTEHVQISYGQATKSVIFHLQKQPGSYNEQYVEAHRGKVTVEIPKVYELSHIILALFDRYHQGNYGMHAEGEYYSDLIDWFSPYKDHAIFDQLRGVDYYSLVENGPAYILENGKLERSDIYSGFRARNVFIERADLVADFAMASHFNDFYKTHEDFYLNLRQTFHDNTKPLKMWRWLERQFPGRHDSYKVFFSPLGGGRHSARTFSDNGFSESVMFVSAPNRYKNKEDSASIEAIKLSRSFFTEIDHTYVNPVSDEYIDVIDAALTNLEPWYRGGSYNQPYLVFNEYMTWSVFSLYAMEHYTPKDYQEIKRYIEDFMTRKRGFSRFEAFNNELTRLYMGKSNDETIVDLYSPIIVWMKSKP